MLSTGFQFEGELAGKDVQIAAGASPSPLVETNDSAKQQKLSAEHGQVRTKLRILFVEDDPTDIELASRALQSAGINPEYDVADSARSFVEHIQRSAYDVVLADYNLPSWNGMGTVEILRNEGLDTPVVLVSGAWERPGRWSASSRERLITY